MGSKVKNKAARGPKSVFCYIREDRPPGGHIFQLWGLPFCMRHYFGQLWGGPSPDTLPNSDFLFNKSDFTPYRKSINLEIKKKSLFSNFSSFPCDMKICPVNRGSKVENKAARGPNSTCLLHKTRSPHNLLNNDRILACYTKKEFPGQGEQLAKHFGPIGPWTGAYRAKNAQVLSHWRRSAHNFLNNHLILDCHTKKEFPGPGEQLAKHFGPIGPWTRAWRAKIAQVFAHMAFTEIMSRSAPWRHYFGL